MRTKEKYLHFSLAALIVLVLTISISLYVIVFRANTFYELFGIVFAQVCLIGLVLLMQRHAEKTVQLESQEVLLARVKSVLDRLGTVRTIHDLQFTVLAEIKRLLDVPGLMISLERSGVGKEITVGERVPGAECISFDLFATPDGRATLFVGTKRNGEPFSNEEIQAMELLTQALTITLDNLDLLDKMSQRLRDLFFNVQDEQELESYIWLQKSMFQLQEAERQRLSADLHDTSMQDFLYLKQRLHAMLDTYRHVMSEPLRNDFQETIEQLDLVHVNLREICFDLFPYTLEIAGLVHSLEQWLKKEQAHCEFAIRFLRPTESAHVQKWEAMETIHKQHLFRVVQELLHNARKHSRASEVCFLLSVEDERMCLHYSDNGAGLPQQVSVSTQRGAGLLQMKQRVKSMNGELVVESKAGAGLQVDIRIPL